MDFNVKSQIKYFYKTKKKQKMKMPLCFVVNKTQCLKRKYFLKKYFDRIIRYIFYIYINVAAKVLVLISDDK